MQLNGIGGGHSSNMHHVTNCIHDHSHYEKDGKIGAAAASKTDVQSMMTAESQADAQFSLTAWLNKTLNGGQNLLGSLWGNGEGIGTAGSGNQSGNESGAEQVLMTLPLEQDDSESSRQGLHTPQIAAAATAVPLPRDIHNNPSFSAAHRSDERQGNPWRRLKTKFKDMTGQLTGHLRGKFSSAQTKNTFQPKQERPKQDLRRHSKLRRDELELNCVPTDDSYLLDSYDRKGEYSKISTKQ